MSSVTDRKRTFSLSRSAHSMSIKSRLGVVFGVPLLILVGYLALIDFAVNPSMVSAQRAYDNTIRSENVAHDAESDMGEILIELSQPSGTAATATTARHAVMAALTSINAQRNDITANVKSLQTMSAHHPRALTLTSKLSRQLSLVLSSLATLTSGTTSLSSSAGSSNAPAALPKPMQDLVAKLFSEITSAESTVKEFVSYENGIMSRANIALADRRDMEGIVSITAVLLATIGGVVVMLTISSVVSTGLKKLELASLHLYKGEELTDLPEGRDEIGRVATEMKKASLELRHRERMLRDQRDEIQIRERLISSIFEAVPDIITVRDTDSKVIRVSPEMQRSLGITVDEAIVLMESFQHVLPEDRQPSLDLQTATIISPHNMSLPLRVRARLATGEIGTFEVRCRPLTSNDGKVIGTVTAARDISGQVVAEDRLRQAKQEADKANQAKSEFLSRMSHELRTPLNSILGFSQLVKMDEITDQVREYVVQIEKGGKHLLSLINEVLDLARVEAGRLSLSVEPVMVIPTISEALDIISPLAFTGHVSLVFNRNEISHFQTVRADSQRLMQVLLNLLDNAVKYNVKGGTVMVNLEQRSCPRGDTMRISVVDTGRGMPPDALEVIFTPFTRLGADSTSIPGTGIGLAITRRLVEAMGGTITVTSEPGKGSTFSVDLSMDQGTANTSPNGNPVDDPMDVEPTGSSQAVDADADSSGLEEASPDSRRERLFTVLYIEDNVASARLMEEILSKRPFVRLIPAALGRLGIDIARQYHPDLILLDLHLEDMSGEDVLREITADDDLVGIPVVMVSADATPNSLERLVGNGAYRYMTKPVDVGAMLEMIDTFASQAYDQDIDNFPTSFSPASHGPEARVDNQATRSFTWRHYDSAIGRDNEEDRPASQ